MKMSERTQVTKIVVYDLPSENYRHIRTGEYVNKVRAVRVWSTYKLHSLGVECTESVILVSPSRLDNVERAIHEVNERYARLREETRLYELVPRIEVLPRYQDQIDPLKRHAEHRIMQRIDETVERVSGLLETIHEITEEARRRTLRYRLNRLAREWNTINELARELGINLTRDIEYLISLIEDASRRAR